MTLQARRRLLALRRRWTLPLAVLSAPVGVFVILFILRGLA